MKLIIFGAGDFAKLMRSYFESYTKFRVIAYCVDDRYCSDSKFDGLELIPRSKLVTYKNKVKVFVAMGYKSMRARADVYEALRADSYQFASFISPLAQVDAKASIGGNVIILHGAVIEPFAKISSNTFINSSVTICHHCMIDKHCFIAANSVVGGYTHIGEKSFLGFNSTILQKLLVAEETLVAASSTILNNTMPHGKYIGTPAILASEHSTLGIQIKE